MNTEPDLSKNLLRWRATFASDTEFKSWLLAPNPLLNAKSPVDWLAEGKARELAEFLEDALTGNPT